MSYVYIYIFNNMNIFYFHPSDYGIACYTHRSTAASVKVKEYARVALMQGPIEMRFTKETRTPTSLRSNSSFGFSPLRLPLQHLSLHLLVHLAHIGFALVLALSICSAATDQETTRRHCACDEARANVDILAIRNVCVIVHRRKIEFLSLENVVFLMQNMRMRRSTIADKETFNFELKSIVILV